MFRSLLSSWPTLGVLLASTLAACAPAQPVTDVATEPSAASQPSTSPAKRAAHTDGRYASLPDIQPHQDVAIFAGGCFWCMEKDFEKVDGVDAVISGYIGGHVDRPTYEQVSSRTSGHAEAVWVLFQPKKVSYDELLTYFWHHIDPTTADRQFCDVGDEYRPEIFTRNDAQKAAALTSKAAISKSKPFAEPIVVKLTPATTFFTAETYHQDFYKKRPAHYQRYRTGCGRDARVKQLWGDAAKSHTKP